MFHGVVTLLNATRIIIHRLMQGWMFLSPFWQAPQVKALVTAVPKVK